MNTFEGNKKMFDLENIDYEAFKGFDQDLKMDVLVISYWETVHTNVEMVFDMSGKYLYTEKHDDWDYIK